MVIGCSLGNAMALVEDTNDDRMAALIADHEVYCKDFGIPTFKGKLRPRVVVCVLKKAVESGKRSMVQSSLQEQVFMNKLFNNRRSFACVRSGIKAWRELWKSLAIQ